MASTATPRMHARWLRSEAVLEAARGALLGWLTWSVVDGLSAVTDPDRGITWEPAVAAALTWLAGSPRALEWIAAKTNARALTRLATWCRTERLYAGLLSARALLTAVVAVATSALLFAFPAQWMSLFMEEGVADAVEMLLVPAAITGAWIAGARRAAWNATTYAAVTGAVVGGLTKWLTQRYLSGFSPEMLEIYSKAIGHPTTVARTLFVHILQGGLLGLAGGLAIERGPATVRLRTRLTVALVVAGVALGLVADVPSLPLVLLPLGWGIALGTTPGAELLLTTARPARAPAASPAAPTV